MDQTHLWDEDPARAQSDPIGARRQLLFLRRNALKIISTALLVAVLGLGVAFLVFNKYAATALILIDPRDAKVTQATEVLSNIGPDSIAIESLVQVANSDGFFGRVVDALNLMSDPEFEIDGATEADRRARTIEKLKNAVRVDRRGMTYVIESTATTKNGAESAKIANKVADMIVDDQSRLRFRLNENAAAWIADHIDEMRDRLHTAEEASAALKAKLKVTDAGQGYTLQERLVSELNQQAVLASTRTAETRARYEQLRSTGSAAADGLPNGLQSPVLSTLREDNARLTRQMAEQAVTFGARYPGVQTLRAQIADNTRQIAAEIRRLVAGARNDFKEAQNREASLTRQLRDAQNDSGETARQLVKLGEIDREAKAQRSVYEQMLTRQKELNELQNLQPTDFRIVSPAVAPIRTTMPKWPLIAIACVILGLASGVGFALVREYLRRTVIRPSQAERLSGVPVVGLAPAIHGLSKRLETAWFDEELRRWVADLRPLGIPHNGKTSQVIFVTSARAGEGKSTIASHLAASISGTVGKVLLIEAEAPRPDRLHRFGLLDVLRQKAGLHRVLGQHPSELFATLPFGGDADIDSQAVGALLGGPKFAEAILACRALYDVIIIDGPAAVDAAYAAGMASVADVTLFVVQWDATDEAFLPYMMDRLHPKAGAIIFNKVNLRRYALLEPFLPGLVERRASAAFKAH